jgi:hypothetical protein
MSILALCEAALDDDRTHVRVAEALSMGASAPVRQALCGAEVQWDIEVATPADLRSGRTCRECAALAVLARAS